MRTTTNETLKILAKKNMTQRKSRPWQSSERSTGATKTYATKVGGPESKEDTPCYDFDKGEEDSKGESARVVKNNRAGNVQVRDHAFKVRESRTWYIDSTTSMHMTPYKEMQMGYKENPRARTIYLADHSLLTQKEVGRSLFW